MPWESFPLCFGCGQENPVGLKLKVREEDGRVWAEFVPQEYHTGFPGMVHGGILCVLLDEVMGYLPHLRGLRAVTGKMQVRFRRPARSGERLRVTAEVLRRRSKVMEVRSTIINGEGAVVAEAISLAYIIGRHPHGENAGPHQA